MVCGRLKGYGPLLERKEYKQIILNILLSCSQVSLACFQSLVSLVKNL